MSNAAITSKGKITIPKEIRDRLKLKPGNRIDFHVGENGRVYLLPIIHDIASLKGIVPKLGKTVSME